MNSNSRFAHFAPILQRRPQAAAAVSGSWKHPDIRGLVRFYQTPYGVLVAAEITGLPSSSGPCKSPSFGFHIHGGASCTGNSEDPFADAAAHYNPGGCPHPYHAGDLPPLLGNGGYAFSVFLTDRFSAEEVVGKAVIVHSAPDDFTTQPGGNAGEKIACGEIRRIG